jgi:N4-gp56 family major capsid protein
MADSQVVAALQVDQWSTKLRMEYVRDMQLRKLMGTSPNAPIQMVEDLAKKPGDDITVPLVTRLTGSGKTGDATLEGQEEALGNYGHKITVDQIRHAVRRGRMEQKKTFFDMLQAARPMLKKWAMAKLRDDILAALQSPNVDGSTAYASCTEAQKDAWLDANSDRILFGAAVANLDQTAPAGGATNDHSGSLSNVDSTSDTLSPAIGSLAKRILKALSGRHVTPVTVGDQGEWYVMLCNSLCFRDLKADSTMSQANRDAMARGKSNPVFTDGDLIYDGVIYKEVPEIPVISGVGDSSIDVAANYLLGAQACGVAVGERLHAIRNVRDYGNLVGVGVAEIRGVDKLMWNSIQNMATVYCAAVADA